MSPHEISPSPFSLMAVVTTRRYKTMKKQVLGLLKQLVITSSQVKLFD